MRRFGFSTGALARGDFRTALQQCLDARDDAVEYSALREEEFEPLAKFLLNHGTGPFAHVAFHAPSHFKSENEAKIVEILKGLVETLGVWVVAHPDSIRTFELWRDLGEHLCIENMDHRKPIGRSADELTMVFQELPRAKLCFDIGHAHEMDRSMSLAYEILKRFRDRVVQVHASEVSDKCEHRAFSASSAAAFARLSPFLPEEAAVILETVVPKAGAAEQMAKAQRIFENPASS
jgi:sugar phosphate isomerase/epimerase